MKDLPFLDAETLTQAVPWRAAMIALRDALGSGLDPSTAPARTALPTAGGELLLMPAASAGAVGVKLVGVSPGNDDLGLPRIQGLYVLFDALTLSPQLLIDGSALTTLRTPAVSALAIEHLATADSSHLVVFGSGPQAEAHVDAVRSIRPITTVTVLARNRERGQELVTRLRAGGLDATTGSTDAVSRADVIVTATTSGTALFDGDLVSDHCCVVAVGSHHPDARELDDRVFARASRVVVEDRATALREAGDIVLAAASGALAVDDLIALADLPSLTATEGLTVFKSVGMGWEDLAVAEAAWRATRPEG
jgi:ornithine cyclodeaminase